jgi:hypothetical protein
MTPEDGNLRDLLEENIELARENNKILKAMRRDALIGGLLKTIIWVVFLVVSIYFTIQYLDPLISSFGNATSGMNPEDFKAIIDFYQGQNQ